MSRHTIKMKYPASWHGGMWRDALRLGNGLTGALMYGAIGEETIQFTRHNLWHRGQPGGEIPDISDTFRQMREMISAGDYKGANTNMMAEALKEKGYIACPEVPYPLGSLRCHFLPKRIFKKYERGIDMRSGEAFVRFRIGDTQFERTAFVSRADDVAVIYIKSQEVFVASYQFEMHEQENVLQEITDNGVLHCRSLDGLSGANVYVKGDVVTEISNGRLDVTGKEYLIFVQVYAEEKPADFTQLRELSYQELLARHTALHTPLYDSVSIELASEENHDRYNEQMLEEAYEDVASPALLEKMWRFGRYLFISAANEEGLPVPLYGLWPGEDDLVWAQYVANENVEMTYWHTLAGGLSYAIKPLIHYYVGKLDVFRECAKKLFGMSGVWISAYTSPGVGGPCVPVGVITNWISCGGWLAQHFWDYYCYTSDRETLYKEIMPFMHEVALFYKDYVTYDENGRMQLCPSVSPENTPGNLMPEFFSEDMGHVAPVVKNATMDFAVMKEFLRNFLTGIEVTGLYQDEAEIYSGLLAQIPPYMVNEDGAIKEWMSSELSDHYNHRHLSHIYPVFPGKEINSTKDADLFSAFKKAVKFRILSGQSGWSLAHMANIYARMQESELALECLDTLVKGIVNNALVTMHNDWRHMGMTFDLGKLAPIQLDANFGLTNALQEMLFHCSGKDLFLLPALPARFETGKLSGMLFPQGTVDLKWTVDKVDVIVSAKTDFTGNIIWQGECAKSLKMKASETCRFSLSK